MRGRRWFLTIALLLHLPLFVYPIVRLGDWLDLPGWLTLLVLLPLVPSQYLSRFVLTNKKAIGAGLYRTFASFWLGLSPVLLMTLLLFEVFVAGSVFAEHEAALMVISTSIMTALVGVLAAMIPRVRRVQLIANQLSMPVRFIQISDVHIGSRSSSFLESIVYRIIQHQPDFVCITGDLVDARDLSETQLRSLRALPMPVYYTTGNHERYEDLENILERLDRLGVNVMRNAAMDFSDEIQILGIDDADRPTQVREQLNALEVDPNRYSILLYHRPVGLEDAAAAGVDLMVSGHTHNGQIFPFRILVQWMFKYMKGLYQHGRTHLYVSQGTGTWGPVMRIGTRSEITLFELSPELAGEERCAMSTAAR